MGMSYFELTQSLADAFNALADEAQSLNDRRVVLEHKLRFAHEQFQHLADKYAPASPEITETLAKLQLPPHTSVDQTSPVPLPRRGLPQSQHEVAVVIRDGRRLASQLASLGETSNSTRDTYSHTSNEPSSSMSTALEQDFTVEGKKGNLQCPFSQRQASGDVADAPDDEDASPENRPRSEAAPCDSEDPICAAMYAESSAHTHGASSVQGATGSKCPIRYMDKHSAEEIAHYVKTHKHELPRSHEVCLRRYQYNEDQIRKLDSKYGNIVSMVESLGQLHQSMLPDADQHQSHHSHQSDGGKASDERVQTWAKTVPSTTGADIEHDEPEADADDLSRQSHFDRPLKEVRVGESPSRPWGISVPIYETTGHEDEHPMSPPPAPVHMHPAPPDGHPPVTSGGKCPFDHTKLQGLSAGLADVESMPKEEPPITPQPPPAVNPSMPSMNDPLPQTSPQLGQPAFIQPSSNTKSPGPQMVFTGPVFIGYPVEQAIQIMNQYRPANP